MHEIRIICGHSELVNSINLKSSDWIDSSKYQIN